MGRTLFFKCSRQARTIGFGVGAMMILLVVQTRTACAGATNAGASAGTGPKTFAFDIPSKPLPQALTDFGNVTGLAILYTQEQPYKLTAPAVSGRFTAAEALDRLLAGSGYTYRFSDSHTVTLEALPPGSAKNAMVLPTLKVQARNGVPAEIETGGPVKGYVATHDFAAEKTNAPILEIPQSISIVTQEQMQQQDVQTIPQALNYTAGVSSTDYGTDSSDDYYTVRGFRPSVYQDGMLTLSPFGAYTPEPFGLDRIEVLKGPSSVLYGQNIPGGLVDLISKRPTPGPLHFFQLQGGSFGRVQGEFDLGGPIDNGGTLLYRLTGLARSSGEQYDFGKNDRVFIAPAFTWHPTDQTTFTFLSRYQQNDDGYPGILPAEGTVTYNPNGTLPTSLNASGPYYYKTQDYSVGYLIEHRLGDIFTLRQNFHYEGYYGSSRYVTGLGLASDQSTLKRAAINFNGVETGIAVDSQAEARLATGPVKHTAVFGVDYWRLTDDSQVGEALARSLDLFAPIYPPIVFPPRNTVITDQVENEVGTYLQDQIKWRRFVLLLSGRHDWAYNDTSNKIAHTQVDQNDGAYTGRVGGLYLFDLGFAPYASYSTSFEPNLGTEFSGTPFQPTSGEEVEVGAKYQPPETNSLFTISLFDMTENNLITPDIAQGFSIATGQVRSRGVELEAVASLSKGLNLISSYTYLDLTNTKTNDPTEGNTPYGEAKHKGSIWLFYTIQKGLLANLGFGAGVRYIGSTWDYTNSIELPDATLVDAAVSYQLKGLKLSLNATNLFDKQYVSICYSSSSCWYGNRLNLIGGASYSF